MRSSGRSVPCHGDATPGQFGESFPHVFGLTPFFGTSGRSPAASAEDAAARLQRHERIRPIDPPLGERESARIGPPRSSRLGPNAVPTAAKNPLLRHVFRSAEKTLRRALAASGKSAGPAKDASTLNGAATMMPPSPPIRARCAPIDVDASGHVPTPPWPVRKKRPSGSRPADGGCAPPRRSRPQPPPPPESLSAPVLPPLRDSCPAGQGLGPGPGIGRAPAPSEANDVGGLSALLGARDASVRLLSAKALCDLSRTEAHRAAFRRDGGTVALIEACRRAPRGDEMVCGRSRPRRWPTCAGDALCDGAGNSNSTRRRRGAPRPASAAPPRSRGPRVAERAQCAGTAARHGGSAQPLSRRRPAPGARRGPRRRGARSARRRARGKFQRGTFQIRRRRGGTRARTVPRPRRWRRPGTRPPRRCGAWRPTRATAPSSRAAARCARSWTRCRTRALREERDAVGVGCIGNF